MLYVGGKAADYAGKVVSTAEEQIDPRTLLRRYEWFKDARAQLDKKRADIALYEQRLANTEGRYVGRDMPRHVFEQVGLWQTEMLGVKASYNSLAAEYNSQMSKINWRFTNVGQLPAGATEAMPREFTPYN